jgi:hypothetical protein
VGLYVAFIRSSLAALLLVLALGLPVAQLAHQASHHHHGLAIADRLALGDRQTLDHGADDEGACPLCQLLNSRPDVAATGEDLPSILATSPAAARLRISAQGIAPACLTIAFARGPPRVS